MKVHQEDKSSQIMHHDYSMWKDVQVLTRGYYSIYSKVNPTDMPVSACC